MRDVWDSNRDLVMEIQDQNLKVVRSLSDSNTATVKVGRSGFMAATLENDGDFGQTKLTIEPDAVGAAVDKKQPVFQPVVGFLIYSPCQFHNQW